MICSSALAIEPAWIKYRLNVLALSMSFYWSSDRRSIITAISSLLSCSCLINFLSHLRQSVLFDNYLLLFLLVGTSIVIFEQGLPDFLHCLLFHHFLYFLEFYVQFIYMVEFCELISKCRWLFKILFVKFLAFDWRAVILQKWKCFNRL